MSLDGASGGAAASSAIASNDSWRGVTLRTSHNIVNVFALTVEADGASQVEMAHCFFIEQ